MSDVFDYLGEAQEARRQIDYWSARDPHYAELVRKIRGIIRREQNCEVRNTRPLQTPTRGRRAAGLSKK